MTFKSLIAGGCLLLSNLLAVGQAPPSLTSQPVGGLVNLGAAATLTASATGSGLKYQWLKNGAMLVGQTNSSIAFAAFQLTNAGNYQLLVTNNAGMALSLPTGLGVPSAGLLGWGNNSGNPLGIGTNGFFTLPMTITDSVVTVASGAQHTLFLTANGSLWGMGGNLRGQLGVGNNNTARQPVLVATNVATAAAGSSHSLFVTRDGLLWSMGYNSAGQLGIGSYDDTNVPTLVASNVVALAGGYQHSHYIQRDGTLWSMGWNRDGELGNGNNVDSNLPVWAASNVVAVACGQDHTIFLKADGTVFTMGYNQTGQLGLGNNNSTNLPQVIGSNAVAVASGSGHTLFLKTNGVLYASGLNGNGQFGIGNRTSTTIPIAIGTNITQAAGGNQHTLLLKGDGSLWAAGDNTYGQLGNGTTTLGTNAIQVPGTVGAALGTFFADDFSLVVGAAAPRLQALTNQTLAAGQPLILDAVATNGTAPLTYQWQFNGTPIPGANTSHYSLPALGLTNAGTYTASVSNLFGSASSQATVGRSGPGMCTSSARARSRISSQGPAAVMWRSVEEMS